jgi:diguanylate cyclase (GGDEF)-like protein
MHDSLLTESSGHKSINRADTMVVSDINGKHSLSVGANGQSATSQPDLFFHAPVAGLLVRQDGQISSINRQAAQLLFGRAECAVPASNGGSGYKLFEFIAEQDQMITKSYLASIFTDRQQHLLDLRLKTKNEREFMARLLSSQIPGEKDLCQMILLDVEKQQIDEEILNHLAYYDQLTGLPNRHLFSDRLHQAVRDARRQSERLAVLLIDLDNFKQVNDTLGHEAGDLLLQAISTRMSGSLREADTLSRLGGDEFTILLQHIADSTDAATIASRLMDAIRQPVTIRERPVQINASIGACLYPDDGDTADLLVHHSDIAMYRSKNSGRNRISFFNDSLKAAVNRQNEMESNLRQALEAHELEVWYQPLVDSINSRIIGLEALLRWRTNHEGVMAAGQFLPLADSLGLFGSFGDWAMQEACVQMKSWLDRGIIGGIGACRMAVNFSGEQLSQSDFADKVKAVLHSSGLPAAALAVEASEASLQLAGSSIFDNLLALKKLGVALHLDDFSQGLNSLQKINIVPFDWLKIDQHYTGVLLENKRGETLLEALVSLAHNLGLQVIAEGVESQHAFNWFKTHACDGMQGYYFCHPLPPVEMEMLLNLRQIS